MDFIVCSKPADFDDMQDSIWYGPEPNANLMRLDFRLRDVRINLTAEEKRERRKAYKRDYNQREETKRMNRERAKDPEAVKKRQEYFQKPAVMEKKREREAVKRLQQRLWKKERPHEFNQLKEAAENEYEKVKNERRSCSTNNSDTSSDSE
jgi:hypothetical protein